MLFCEKKKKKTSIVVVDLYVFEKVNRYQSKTTQHLWKGESIRVQDNTTPLKTKIRGHHESRMLQKSDKLWRKPRSLGYYEEHVPRFLWSKCLAVIRLRFAFMVLLTMSDKKSSIIMSIDRYREAILANLCLQFFFCLLKGTELCAVVESMFSYENDVCNKRRPHFRWEHHSLNNSVRDRVLLTLGPWRPA